MARIKTISVGKEIKIGLPNYSNVTARCDIAVDVGEQEVVTARTWDEIWDTVNQQLSIQSSGIDPSWIQTKEYKNFFSVQIKQPKENGNQG